MATTKDQLNRYFAMIDRRVPTRVSQFMDEAQQNLRRVHGGQKAGYEESREEIQRRSARTLVGKFLISMVVLSVSILLAVCLHVIAL